MTTTEPGPAGVTDIADLSDPELISDPFGEYARIRERAPLVRGVLPGVDPVWLVTRYDDVRMVLSDPRFVKHPGNVPGVRADRLGAQLLRGEGFPESDLKYWLSRMQEYDGADHARLRGLVSQAFTARRVAALRPRIERITEDLLDQLPAAGPDGVVDLLARFAYPLPHLVLCELAGIPEADRRQWGEWRAAVSTPAGMGAADIWREVVAYLRELIARRRAQPADDLISGLTRAQDADGDRLSEPEMIGMILVLSMTGHLNITHLIGNGVAALLTHPEQLALLRARPQLLPKAIHELLRWCGPTKITPHLSYAAADLEIGGMPVRKGEALMPVLAAANHDPRRFDDPGRFDITREPDGRRVTHVSFGHGPHFCLGATLTVVTGEAALGALLRRYPGLALAVDPDDLEREPLPRQWRLKALPVRLSVDPRGLPGEE